MRTGRRAAVVAAVAVAGLLAGCVGSVSNSGKTDAKKLVLIPGVANEPFYISMQCGASDEAKKLGYSLDTQAPSQFDASLQTPIVTGVIANKPGAILIAPTHAQAMASPIKQAKDAGIKVIEVDTALQDTSIALSSISSDNVKGGRLAAQTLAKLVGDKGSVLVINTKAGTSTTDQRAQGFGDELKQSHPGMTSLGVQYNNNEAAQAASIVTATLAAHPDLAGIFATNLSSAEGAATGLRNAGKLGQVKVVGFDASPKQVQDLKDGTVQALIAQNPGDIGKQGVDQAAAALEGKPVTRTIQTDMIAITQDNMSANDQYFYKSKC
ncbi:ABC transporter substrate-binding protein [Nocardia seriolae]|uniref:ABC transporter substrate-binding protein n=1 Tax=Nocardia seriolae TaxID=37332 RepID=UPI000BBA6DC0|nr:ABC transporter substrate-binding protein [Nocardia seriolae]MTJ62695.1 substrate-binding domain-containing protein [Nocardia seriolae]MTJ74823.1 substrate-binding domain-containing protein [Nocardia seriolae]MTJ87732.1 substrate-binding domain-containing protein [Nocardia seriolae]MTK31725.1 substrate-binding domain-containing protein [Nocardia seriolae]MTK40628.1 substrate-binding domain-containing protein [Nocardia seriolae]